MAATRAVAMVVHWVEQKVARTAVHLAAAMVDGRADD